MTTENNKNIGWEVPEGYFDTLDSRIMANIAQEDKEDDGIMANIAQTDNGIIDMRNRTKAKIRQILRWTSSAAACTVLALVGIHYYNSGTATPADVHLSASITEEQNDEYTEDMMNYTNLDDHDVYCYLNGDEY